MARGDVRVRMPNPHQGDVGVESLTRILKEAGVSKQEWEQLQQPRTAARRSSILASPWRIPCLRALYLIDTGARRWVWIWWDGCAGWAGSWR
jgi:hypothetical protein